jgi:hypothetical protein
MILENLSMNTQAIPTKMSPIPAERFDGNQAELYGTVTKIWSRIGGDVFARVATHGKEGEEHPSRVTIKFPKGKIDGGDISLMAGDGILVHGWISDGPYTETLVNFLTRARQEKAFDLCPELKPLEAVEVKRGMTFIIPENLEFVPSEELKFVKETNQVRVEGIVSRVWEHKGSKYLRLAVYDRYSVAQNETAKYGRPKRTPHYVTIQFANGKVDGRPITLHGKDSKDKGGIKIGDRIRITGRIGESFYKESLRTFLLSAKQAEAMAAFTNPGVVDEAWSSYSETCVVADTLIHYTRSD